MENENRKSYTYIIRVLPRDVINKFSNGEIRFGLPIKWRKSGDGRNDISEGVLAIHSVGPFVKLHMLKNREYKNMIIIRDGEMLYQYDKRVDYVPTLCFYGIETNDKDFYISNKYFEDFVNDKEKYGFVVVEATKFYSRLNSALSKYGFDGNALYFRSINYVDKSIGFLSNDFFPNELLHKDINYKYQKEVRFIITDYDEMKLELLKKDNYTVTIDTTNLLSEAFEIPSDNEVVHVYDDGEMINIRIERNSKHK